MFTSCLAPHNASCTHARSQADGPKTGERVCVGISKSTRAFDWTSGDELPLHPTEFKMKDNGWASGDRQNPIFKPTGLPLFLPPVTSAIPSLPLSSSSSSSSSLLPHLKSPHSNPTMLTGHRDSATLTHILFTFGITVIINNIAITVPASALS
ncbi:hypothetical protein EGR_00422 [Echinococcus granulosus]|uniref:Uncharacterized protein n=1 Tax=Echinococcus granulosus TaxID=6210 RepID=W6V0R3_ECHGR|nr:hypothetical protein EGR_00422 [Echinococcus granulosus]EUB64472.1 hypothetical protein EGR_00422 [Echinococcus granulosus]